MVKNKYRSSQLQKKKKMRRIIKTVFFTAATLVLIYGAVFWSNHPTFTISQINISDLQYADQQTVLEEAEHILDEKHLGLISKRNIFLLPRAEIRNHIKENHNSFSEIKVSVKRFDILDIKITEHEPVAKWCGSNVAAPKECFLINLQGNIFAKENNFMFENVLKFYSPLDFSDEQELIGRNVLNADIFENIIFFANNLPELNITAKSIQTDNHETFSVQTTAGPRILIETDDEATQLLNNLKVMIETENINEAQFKNLDYINLSFGNKVFYKPR